MRRVLALAAAILAVSCTPVVSQRGYLTDPELVQSIRVGEDSKNTLAARFGNPSTTATFGEEIWYYISGTEQQVAFFSPRQIDRNILAISFNKEGTVTDVRHYGLEDGRVVAFVERETPTKGKELTLLQQLFASVPGATRPGAPQGGPDQ